MATAGKAIERVCRVCGNLKPIALFKWKDHRNGTRDTMCRPCGVKLERKHIMERKLIEREEGLKGLVQQVRQSKLNAPHISEYLDVVLRKLGGVEVLATMQVDQIEMLLEMRPGSPAAVNSLKDVVKLIVASTQHRDSAPDLAQITDEQLNELLVNQITTRLAENPNFLEDAAFSLGYALVPLQTIDSTSEPAEPEQPAAPALEAPAETPDA